MRYRTLPGTELNVSEVCLGTMTWGEQNSEAEAHAQLDYAVAQGINFIDTAEMYPVPPNAHDAGAHRDVPRQLARAPAARRARDRDQGRRARAPRLDPQRTHRSDARRDRRGRRHEPRATADRRHRPLPDPLAAAQRADVRRDRVRSVEGEGRAADPRAGRGHGRDDQGRQDPPLRPVERNGLGRVRIPARRAKELGVPGPVTIQNSYSLVSRNVDNDLAETLFREKMSLLAYSPLAAGMLSGKYLGGAQPPNARFTLFDGLGMRFRKPMVGEAVEAYVGAREAARRHAGAARAGLREEPLVSRRVDHRRDDDGAARGRHRRGAVRARCARRSAEIAAIQLRYPNPAG